MAYATSGGGPLHTTAVSVVITTPTQLLATRDRNNPPTSGIRVGFRLQNLGANDVYWSENPAVAASGANQGFLLKGGQIPPTEYNDILVTGPIYAVASGGTSVVIVGEVY